MTITSDELDQQLRMWIIETRNGDHQNYKSLLRETSLFIRRNAYNVLQQFHCPDLAEDITQETLIAIHMKLPIYDIHLSFLAWVRAVMKHKIIDQLRRLKNQPIYLEDISWEEPISKENIAQDMTRRDLHKLLDTLKPPTGEIIYALKVEGITIKDLAKEHRMTESNIKILVHRGLQKLSTLILQNREGYEK